MSGELGTAQHFIQKEKGVVKDMYMYGALCIAWCTILFWSSAS